MNLPFVGSATVYKDLEAQREGEGQKKEETRWRVELYGQSQQEGWVGALVKEMAKNRSGGRC